MINTLYFFIGFYLFLKGAQILYFLQLKEYRLDRLKDFFLHEKGFLKIYRPREILLILLFILVLSFNDLLAVVILFINCLILIKSKIYFKLTLKSGAVYLAYLVIQFIIILLSAKLSVLTPLLTLLIISSFFTPITLLVKNYIINKAKKKISTHKNLKVIAITGSYGKTSVKEFLATLLSEKYRVLKTPKNINTEIGVAKIILNYLKPEHQIFIVEAGAYTKNEIAKTVSMFSTDTAVITSIDNQHLALFKSLDNIKKAKFEITNSLKSNGNLYLNLDSTKVEELYSEINGKTEYAINTYSTKKQNSKIKIKILETEPKLKFKVDNSIYNSSLLGAFNCSNLGVAIKIAQEYKLSEKQILKGVDKITAPSQTLKRYIGVNKSTVIDDSYNCNYQGFLEAVQVCANLDYKTKILITPGMYELGDKAQQYHEKIFQEASEIFNYIFITRPDILNFIAKNSRTKFVYLKPDELKNNLTGLTSKNCLILLENRIPSKVYEYLIK